MNNPYKPPNSDPRKRDRWNESIENRPQETDWGGFLFIFCFLNIFFFHKVLFNFFLDIFRSILYK